MTPFMLNLHKVECFVLLLAATWVGRAADFAPWEFRQRFEVPSAGLVKVALTPELLGASQPGLADLRLVDPAGVEVPFLVQHPMARAAATFEPKRTETTLRDGATVVWIETGRTSPVETITLSIPTPRFLKAVTVEGSVDNRTWKSLRTGAPVFGEPAGPQQTTVEIEPAVWAFLRVALDDRRTDPVPVTGATLGEAPSGPVGTEWLPARISDQAESSGESRFVVELPAANLPVDLLEVETPEPLFRRAVRAFRRDLSDEQIVETPVGGGTLYRIELEGSGAVRQLGVPVTRPLSTREVVLAVANGDSPALRISSVRVRVRPSHLVFGATRSGSFTFRTGNPLATSPRYDVASLGAAVNALKPSDIRPAALERDPGFRPAEALAGIGALGGAVDLPKWSVRRAVTVATGAVARLELDLPALSGARPDLGDVRLVCAGKQVPFLVDRTSLSRPVPVELKPLPDAKHPSLGRWEIRLPMAGVPLRELVVTTTSPLFDRTFRLLEITQSQRGEEVRARVAEQRWVRTPESKAPRMTFSLNRVVAGAVLELETDNGDNAPVEISAATASRPVTRLLFKSPADGPVDLIYGNADAAPPRYDLGLLGRELFASTKQPAQAAEAATRPGGGVGWRSASWILWAVLVLVVGGLLAVISRWLPKPNAPGRDG
jgi:hypothetical protein